MKIGGCLLTVIGFLSGASITAAVDFYYAWKRPYIDRVQAMPLALHWARHTCLRDRPDTATECSHIRLISVSEASDGWHFVFRSRDGRQTSTAWVGRLGEVDDN